MPNSLYHRQCLSRFDRRAPWTSSTSKLLVRRVDYRKEIRAHALPWNIHASSVLEVSVVAQSLAGTTSCAGLMTSSLLNGRPMDGCPTSAKFPVRCHRQAWVKTRPPGYPRLALISTSPCQDADGLNIIFRVSHRSSVSESVARERESSDQEIHAHARPKA